MRLNLLDKLTPTETPSNTILSAIKDIPKTTSITVARSWFRLVNQVAWAYSLSPIYGTTSQTTVVKHNTFFPGMIHGQLFIQ